MCFLKAFALIATSRFELKKNVSKVSEKKAIAWKKCTGGEKDYYRHRRCPVNGSKLVVKRLSNHIQQVYKRIKRLSCLQTAIIEHLNRGGEYGSVQDLPHLGP